MGNSHEHVLPIPRPPTPRTSNRTLSHDERDIQDDQKNRDPNRSLGTCYRASHLLADPGPITHPDQQKLIACGNSELDYFHCCHPGDLCLSNHLCLYDPPGRGAAGDVVTNREKLTYVGGCTDAEYGDESCIAKLPVGKFSSPGYRPLASWVTYCEEEKRWSNCDEAGFPFIPPDPWGSGSIWCDCGSENRTIKGLDHDIPRDRLSTLLKLPTESGGVMTPWASGGSGNSPTSRVIVIINTPSTNSGNGRPTVTPLISTGIKDDGPSSAAMTPTPSATGKPLSPIPGAPTGTESTGWGTMTASVEWEQGEGPGQRKPSGIPTNAAAPGDTSSTQPTVNDSAGSPNTGMIVGLTVLGVVISAALIACIYWCSRRRRRRHRHEYQSGSPIEMRVGETRRRRWLDFNSVELEYPGSGINSPASFFGSAHPQTPSSVATRVQVARARLVDISPGSNGMTSTPMRANFSPPVYDDISSITGSSARERGGPVPYDTVNNNTTTDDRGANEPGGSGGGIKGFVRLGHEVNYNDNSAMEREKPGAAAVEAASTSVYELMTRDSDPYNFGNNTTITMGDTGEPNNAHYAAGIGELPGESAAVEMFDAGSIENLIPGTVTTISSNNRIIRPRSLIDRIRRKTPLVEIGSSNSPLSPSSPRREDNTPATTVSDGSPISPGARLRYSYRHYWQKRRLLRKESSAGSGDDTRPASEPPSAGPSSPPPALPGNGRGGSAGMWWKGNGGEVVIMGGMELMESPVVGISAYEDDSPSLETVMMRGANGCDDSSGGNGNGERQDTSQTYGRAI